MSGRAFRKLYLQPKEEKKDQEEEEEIDGNEKVEGESFSGPVNAFDLLSMNEEGENEDVEEEEEEETVESSVPKGNLKKVNKKKKKKKLRSPKEEKKKEGKEEESLDEILRQYGSSQIESTPLMDYSTEKTIWEIDSKFLDPRNEEIRLFGKQTMSQVQKESGRRRGSVHKRYLLVNPGENWPRILSGVSMDFLGTKDGSNYFAIRWTQNYRKQQEQFFQCVSTHDPASFQIILQKNPYHLDSLLQLSEVLKQTGEMERAKDFIERCLYCFESSWHHLFNPLLGNCRLDYSIEENKTFFLAIFRYIQILGREGNSRTALEYCKLLLSLDPSDPLCVLFLIDSFCIRSGEYAYLMKLFWSKELSQRVSYMPNFVFSVALAKFHTETKKNVKKGKEVESDILMLKTSADDLLQSALLLFPMMLPPLLKKCSLNWTHTIQNSTINLTEYSYFKNSFCPPSLLHLISLYTARNYSLWKVDTVPAWLKKNVISTIDRVELKDPMALNCSTIIREEFGNANQNVYNHLLLSEHTDQIDALPPDLLQNDGGAQLYEMYQAQPVVHAPTNNPFGLFLYTLFNPVIPNAPAQEQNSWYDTLLGWLHIEEQEEQQHPHEE